MIYHELPNPHQSTPTQPLCTPFHHYQSNRLQQLKMNNPFQKMYPGIRIPPYKQQPQPTHPFNPSFNRMQNPFHRKYLIHHQSQSNYFDYLQFSPKSRINVNLNSEISEVRNTFQSLEFLPSTKKYPDDDKNKQVSKNRLGGDYNNQQIRFSVEKGESRFFNDMLQNSSKENITELERSNRLKPRSNIFTQQIIDEIESESKPTDRESVQSKEIVLNQRESQRASNQVSDSPVNSLTQVKMNQLSYYQQTIQLEGKNYYLIPFKNN